MHTLPTGTRLLMRLGDADVDFDPNFKFYIATATHTHDVAHTLSPCRHAASDAPGRR